MYGYEDRLQHSLQVKKKKKLKYDYDYYYMTQKISLVILVDFLIYK